MTKMEGLLQAIAEQDPIPRKTAGTGDAPVSLDTTHTTPAKKKRRVLPKAAVALQVTPPLWLTRHPCRKKAKLQPALPSKIQLCWWIHQKTKH